MAIICLLTTTSAWADVTIYVSTADANSTALYIFNNNGGSTTVDGKNYNSAPVLLTKSKLIGGKTWWYETFSGMNSCSAIFTKSGGSWTNQTADITGVSGNKFYTYDSSKDKNNNNCSDVTSQYIDYLGVTWTVAGSSGDLFGTTWDTGNTANDMTTTDDVNYTWSKENVELSAGTVKFKVCKNHGWDTAYPSSDYELSIESNGTYNVTITFNSSTHDVNATATAVQTTPDVYYVRGNNESFFGSNPWGNNDNVMTTTDDTNYIWTSGQATLSANENVEFKVVKNGSEWIGDNNGNNVTCAASQAGVYTLTVNYTVGGVPTGTLNLIAATPDAPTFTPAAGTYNSNQKPHWFICHRWSNWRYWCHWPKDYC